MTAKIWYMLGFEDHYPRIVADDVMPSYQRDREDSWGDCGDVFFEPREEVVIDRGGVMMVSRTLQTVDVDGLSISVPTTELLAFLAQLEAAEPVSPDFYEVRGALHVIVLTGLQRLALLDAWRRLEAGCRAQAMEEMMRFEQALLAANQHPNIMMKGPPGVLGSTPKDIN